MARKRSTAEHFRRYTRREIAGRQSLSSSALGFTRSQREILRSSHSAILQFPLTPSSSPLDEQLAPDEPHEHEREHEQHDEYWPRTQVVGRVRHRIDLGLAGCTVDGYVHAEGPLVIHQQRNKLPLAIAVHGLSSSGAFRADAVERLDRDDHVLGRGLERHPETSGGCLVISRIGIGPDGDLVRTDDAVGENRKRRTAMSSDPNFRCDYDHEHYPPQRK